MFLAYWSTACVFCQGIGEYFFSLYALHALRNMAWLYYVVLQGPGCGVMANGSNSSIWRKEFMLPEQALSWTVRSVKTTVRQEESWNQWQCEGLRVDGGECIMSGAGENKAGGGGGPGGAPSSAIFGCCDFWEPVAEHPLLRHACSVWLCYFKKICFGSRMQNLVALNQWSSLWWG